MIKNHLAINTVKRQLVQRKLFLASSGALMMYMLQPLFKTSFYMDEKLEKVKNEIEDYITSLKRKHGE